MYTKLNAAAASILLAAVSIVMLSGCTLPEEKYIHSSGGHVGNLGKIVSAAVKAASDPLAAELAAEHFDQNSQPQPLTERIGQQVQVAQFSANELVLERPREDVYSYAKKNSGSGDAPAGACMESVKKMPKTGNSVIDTRCSLVAFEVCMNKAIGTISQSQDSKKQCAIMQGLGGPTACRQPCIDATKLPVGGGGTVVTKENTYTKLTPFAVSCYEKIMNVPGGNVSACDRNEALQCLMNGSSVPGVNAAIRQERKDACTVFYRQNPKNVCAACYKGHLRVDYDSKKVDLDSDKCNPALAAAGHCAMPVR